MTSATSEFAAVKRTRYLVVGTLVLICLGAMYSWSYYKAAISSVFPVWNEKQLSMTFTLMMICFALGGLAGGRLSKWASAKTLTIIAGILIFLSYQSVSLLPVVNVSPAARAVYMLWHVDWIWFWPWLQRSPLQCKQLVPR